MQRAGVSMPASRFVFEVARAYEVLQTGTSAPGLIEPRLRRCHSYPVFVHALKQAGRTCSALILGCGEGLCGLDAGYTREEWSRVWPDTAKVTVCNVSVPLLEDPPRWPSGGYDAVVSHSMVHYIYRIDLFFQLVSQALRPGGAYVMGHEVNARFWRRPELVEATAGLRDELRRGGGLRRYFDPKTHWHRAGRLLGIEQPPGLVRGINLVLRRRLGTTADLTLEEISRLIEIHRPLEMPSALQIGWHGFDTAELAATFLRGYEIAWSGSSGFVGFTHPDHVPGNWRARDGELARRYPEDGVYFSACWRKGA